MTFSLLLVAPLDEPISVKAHCPQILQASEIVAALERSAHIHAGLDLTLIAARGSETGVPLIGVDPFELGETSPMVRAMLLQAVAMAGGWDGYDLVHCLAPAPGAAQLHAMRGGRLLYSPLAESDLPFLAALRRLGAVDTADPAAPCSIAEALHPVDPARYPFSTSPRTALYRAPNAAQISSRHRWTTVDAPAAIDAGDAAVVLGPSTAGRLTHLCWATRSLMAGAAYLYDGDDLAGIDWPEGGVRRLTEQLDAMVETSLQDYRGAERFRRWALAHCAPAATASALRRRYERMRVNA